MDLRSAEQVNEVNRSGGNILEYEGFRARIDMAAETREGPVDLRSAEQMSEANRPEGSRSPPFVTCLNSGVVTLGLILFASTALGAYLSPQEALSRLLEGNQRYVNDELEHPNRTSERREATLAQQTPFAVIVGCSDSRVSPEIIFDQGIGDLFIVRVAGNVIGPLELESIEFATFALKSVLILVLGHENCGAIKAVIQGKTEEIPALALIIGPAVKGAKDHDPAGVLKAAIKANALHMKDLLFRSGKLGKLAKKKEIDIEAAYYNLQTGEVELL